MSVSDLLRPFRPLLGALAIVLALAALPAFAQSDDGMGQSFTGSNPTAQAVNERQLLQELDKLQGRVSIPNAAAGMLEQPQGRDYREFHEGALPWIGAILILGMLVLLALFFFIKGRIRLEGGYAGVKILRFNWFERFNHWMTATAFIVLAITGVNYVYGKRLLMPLIGPEAFGTWSGWAKIAHNFVAWPFMIGIAIMLVIWIKDNFPRGYDWTWLKRGGGFLDGSHPPAGRFNAGQKLIFWTVILGGLALSASGVVMLFPFTITDVNGMQWAQYVHSVTGMIMFAVILAHIYIGSLGMERAFEAMGDGEVDLAWAEAHHPVWVEKQQARTLSGAQLPHGAATPAE